MLERRARIRLDRDLARAFSEHVALNEQRRAAYIAAGDDHDPEQLEAALSQATYFYRRQVERARRRYQRGRTLRTLPERIIHGGKP